MTQKLDKVVYRAQATATGGRDGVARSSDGQLNIQLGIPLEMGGNGKGVNPEQLFAAGYSACFIGAMRFVAGQSKQVLPADTQIDATVGIGPIPQGFGIEVQLAVHIPGWEREAAEALVQKAHIVCPYSNATRGNIEVTLSVV
ncbi:MAG: organic hydroperoxide resistance protein [Rhodoferax sp.]